MGTTINDAIIQVLKSEGKPLSPKEIFTRITQRNLYQFKAENAENIVRNQLRRHSENVERLAAASKMKHFVSLEDGKYWLTNSHLSK